MLRVCDYRVIIWYDFKSYETESNSLRHLKRFYKGIVAKSCRKRNCELDLETS